MNGAFDRDPEEIEMESKCDEREKQLEKKTDASTKWYCLTMSDKAQLKPYIHIIFAILWQMSYINWAIFRAQTLIAV